MKRKIMAIVTAMALVVNAGWMTGTVCAANSGEIDGPGSSDRDAEGVPTAAGADEMEGVPTAVGGRKAKSVPAVASADSGGDAPAAKTVNINVDGTLAGITGPEQPSSENDPWKGCYLYYGKFNGTPVKYRILDAATTDFGSEATMFLDCDSVLEKENFHNNRTEIANGQTKDTSEWKYSDLYMYLNSLSAVKGSDGKYTYSETGTGFLSTAFTKAEQDAIAGSTNNGSSENYHGSWPDGGVQIERKYTDLTGEKIFILDFRETIHGAYGYYDSVSEAVVGRKKLFNISQAYEWWLRSVPGGYAHSVSAVRKDGSMLVAPNVDAQLGISPAFNLKLSSVLFTLASKNGVSLTDRSEFALTEDTDATEWTVSIPDGNMDFSAALDGSGQVPVKGMIKLKNISGAASNQISAMLVDRDNTVVAYGKIAEAGADHAEVRLPAGVETGSYTLKVFSEQVDMGDCTSYASNMVDIPIRVMAKTVNLNENGAFAGITDPERPSSENAPWKGSYLYYGKFNGTPVKYRILDAATTDFGSEATMFLDCDSVLEKRQFNSVKAATNGQARSDDWKYSDLYLYLNSQTATEDGGSYTYAGTDTGFLAEAFTEAEQGAIAGSTHTEDSENYHGNWDVGLEKNQYYPFCNLTGEKIFILDSQEANYAGYGYCDDYNSSGAGGTRRENRIKYCAGEASWWWMRSNYLGMGSTVRTMKDDGTNQLGSVDNIKYGVSPALNLKLSSVLFISSAEVESGTGVDKAEFALTADTDTAEWVATLYNGNAGFHAALDGSASIPLNKGIQLKDLSGAGAALESMDGTASSQISAMLVDGDNTVVAYGKIAEISADHASIALPDGLGLGHYTLKVFSEQANAGNVTSYASNMVDIPVEIVAAVQEQPPATPTPPAAPTPTPEVPTPTSEVPTPAPGTPVPAIEPTAPPVVTPEPEPDESHLDGNQIVKRKDLSLLLATGRQKGSRGVELTWKKVTQCSGYEVYWSFCDGKKDYKKLKTVSSSGKRKCTHNKLKKDRAYKYYVATYQIKNGRKTYKAKSPVIHVAMKQERRTNAKSIKVKKAKVTLKVLKTFQIRATVIVQNKKKKLLDHEPKFRYYTDDGKVAAITKKGKVKAKKKGTCAVYVIANNGVSKKIKVTVK